MAVRDAAGLSVCVFSVFFFFNDTATTEISTLSLHDALPISHDSDSRAHGRDDQQAGAHSAPVADRKSTRLNSSHGSISYAAFFLKKNKNAHHHPGNFTLLEAVCLAVLTFGSV